MAEYYVDPENGNDANPGTEAEPWLLIPGQTGANTVTAGDIINVKNGTTTTLRIVPPAQNLTYRGYGLASNVLELTLPGVSTADASVRRVVREVGSHEGMWIIDQDQINASAIGGSATSVNGVTFEDVHIQGPSSLGTHNCIQIGTSTSAATLTGFTIRRFRISNSNNRGMSMYIMNVTAELGRIEYTKDDNITLWGLSTNSGRVGSVDTLRLLDLREPNLAFAGDPSPGSSGDFIQNVPNSGDYSGTTIINDVLGRKTESAKQAMVLHCMSASSRIEAKRVNIGGGGSVAILVGHLKGSAVFEDIVIDPGSSSELPLFRFDPADTSPPAYAMDTGSSLTIKNVLVNGARCPGLYSSVYTAGAYSFDGSIDIENCTTLGVNDASAAYASSVSLWSTASQSTYGMNYRIRLRNNYLGATGKPHFILPTGSAGDAKFSILGNCVSAGGAAIGSTSYASLAAFQAAHSQARGNLDSDPKVSADGTPLPGSRLLRGGVDTGDIIAINGVRGRGLIGALGRKSVSLGNPGNFVQARLAIVREQQLELLRKQLEEDSDDLDS